MRKEKIMNKKCDMVWEMLESEYVYQCPWLSLRKDAVRTAKGVDIPDFYVLEYPIWVNVIAKTSEGFYIIERQYRHGIQQIVYELCAGICEQNEKPIEAAKRELLEETGFAGGNWSYIGRYAPNPSAMNNWSYTFLADGVTKQCAAAQEQTEDIQFFLLDERELLELMTTGKIVEGVMLAPLWQYFSNKK